MRARSAVPLMIMMAGLVGGCATPVGAAPTQPPTTPAQASDTSCTNRIDYAGDPRSNAELNSLGERTGTCPTPRPYRADTSCTNWIDYAGDPRSNAEINSEGEQTGSCPAPQK
ncbi:hypothetical protein ACQEVB_22835 [Pseudonocardia sp. CA-107938]|uniref:hypothetical protein n=1 Tax=Pseudonocardia sp. CA-107938 TaxID=3240021 RepID=UPI003D92F491